MEPASKWTREEFEKHVIASDDDNDYSQSGWVAVVRDGVAYLAHYSHCSCYGTFEALCGDHENAVYDFEKMEYTSPERGTPSFAWTGPVEELIRMAQGKLDPDMPTREANPEDYDYDHLCKVYEEVLAYFGRAE